MKYHKLTSDELKSKVLASQEIEKKQKELSDLAKKVMASEDFKALKINYELTLQKVIDSLIDSVDSVKLDELGIVAFQYLHRIKYLKGFIKTVEAKGQ
jgi:hypothetical protein